MTYRLSLLLSMLLTVAVASSCNNKPVDDGRIDPPVPESELTIEITETSPTSVEFCVTPIDDTLTYIVMMTTLDYFNEFESGEALIDDDLLWFDEMAFDEGISYYDVIARMLKSGTHEAIQGNLTPESDYVIYAYGLSPRGEILTELFTLPFTTPAVDKEEVNFKIEVTEIGFSDALFSITPESEDTLYFAHVLSQTEYDHWGGSNESFEQHLEELRNYYLDFGVTIEQIVANLGYVGSKRVQLSDLRAGTKYYAYALAINEEFLAVSEPTVITFETRAVEQSDLQFEVTFSNISYDRMECNITPSNDNESYICSVQRAESLDWYASEEDFIAALITEFNVWHGGVENVLHTGTYTLNSKGLSPESEYIVVCFGYNEAATTKLCTFSFSTPAPSGSAEDLEISFTISDITHNSVRVTTDPSVGVHYFVTYAESARFDEKVAELGSTDLAVIHLANADIDYGAEWFGCSRAEYLFEVGAYLGYYTTPFTQLSPSTEYIAFAVAVDLDSGEIASQRGHVSERYTTLEKITSKAGVTIDIDKYYDGTELSKLDPARFLNCYGRVIVPYSITANEYSASWYTGFFSGDYTEWGATDDDIYAELITYGYECGSDLVSVNSDGGVAILNYNTPFSFLGIAADSEEHFGAATIKVVNLSPEGASPAQEFLDKINGQSLSFDLPKKGVKME